MALLFLLFLASVGGTLWSFLQHQWVSQGMSVLEQRMDHLADQGERGQAQVSQLSQAHQLTIQYGEKMEEVLEELQEQALKLQKVESAVDALREHAQEVQEKSASPRFGQGFPEGMGFKQEGQPLPPKDDRSALSYEMVSYLKHLLSSPEAFEVNEEMAQVLPQDILDSLTKGAARPRRSFPQLLKVFKESLGEALNHQVHPSRSVWQKIADNLMRIRKTGERAVPGSLDHRLFQVEQNLGAQNAYGALEALHQLPEEMHPAFEELASALETLLLRQELLDLLAKRAHAPQEAP